MADVEGGISRRHVMAGVAWSAPAIVIATAVPAAAASPAVPGGVALTSLTASMVEVALRVTGFVSYVGDAAPSPDLPVTDVILSVRVPTSRVRPGNAEARTPLWTALAPVPVGAETVYRFRWDGDALTGANSVTLPLEASIPKLGALDPLTVVFTADGVSNAVAVPQDQVIVDATVGANLVLNSEPAVRYQQSGATEFQYAFDGTTRWAGPYYPVGAEATGIKVTATIPQANSTGQLVQQNYGAGWTLESPPTLVGSNWVVVFNYANALNPTFQNTSTLQFALIALQPGITNIATLRTEGQTAGYTASDEEVGPSTLVIRGWTDTPVYLGGEIRHPFGHPGDEEL